MADWKNWWKNITKGKSESNCGCNDKGSCVSSDCNCGCTETARDSVRLTDAEIAEDIVNGLEELCGEYECLCREGCDCEEKLCSCRQAKECLCEFINK